MSHLLNEDNRLAILFDGIEHLLPLCNAHTLNWLPRRWPAFVTVVMTTDTNNQQTMRNLSAHVEQVLRSTKDDCDDIIGNFIVKIQPLDVDEQSSMVDLLLHKQSRTLTDNLRQVDISLHCLFH